MGAIPSKVGSRPNGSKEALYESCQASRLHSSLSLLNSPNSQEFTRICRPSGGCTSGKLYRKNIPSDLLRNASGSTDINSNSTSATGLCGSQSALHRIRQADFSGCRRCDALCQLAVDKDIIIGSLEGVITDLRIKLVSLDGQLREVKSRGHSKRQILTLKLFEARERICLLEELCSTHNVQTDGNTKRSTKIYLTNEGSDTELETDLDEEDGLKRQGYALSHLVRQKPLAESRSNKQASICNNFNILKIQQQQQQRERPSTAGSASTAERLEKLGSYSARQSKPPQRTVSSGVHYNRRRQLSGSAQLQSSVGSVDTSQTLSSSQQWAIGTVSDTVYCDNPLARRSPPRGRTPRRSATISAGSYAAMTGQPRRRG